jgi:Leucine-rich repeat (LRR) protein
VEKIQNSLNSDKNIITLKQDLNDFVKQQKLQTKSLKVKTHFMLTNYFLSEIRAVHKTGNV